MLRPLDEPMVIQLHVVHNLKFAIRIELGKIVPARSGKAAMATRATKDLEIDMTTAGAISADDLAGGVPDIPRRARAGFLLRRRRHVGRPAMRHRGAQPDAPIRRCIAVRATARRAPIARDRRASWTKIPFSILCDRTPSAVLHPREARFGGIVHQTTKN
jgi:hypothetical protein